MDSYIIQVHYLEKEALWASFCVAMHLQELSAADVLLSVQVLGYTVPVITRVLVPRNDAPCSSVCILGKCGSRNGDFTSFGGEKPGCLIIGVLGSFRPGCSIEGNGQIRENRVKLVCDHDQINRISRNIPSVFDDKGIG